jgi:hypothetical protein
LIQIESLNLYINNLNNIEKLNIIKEMLNEFKNGIFVIYNNNLLNESTSLIKVFENCIKDYIFFNYSNNILLIIESKENLKKKMLYISQCNLLKNFGINININFQNIFNNFITNRNIPIQNRTHLTSNISNQNRINLIYNIPNQNRLHLRPNIPNQNIINLTSNILNIIFFLFRFWISYKLMFFLYYDFINFIKLE